MRKLRNKTAMNKLLALLLLCICILSIFIDGDITGLIVGLPLVITLWLLKTNVVVKDIFSDDVA